MRPSTQPDVLSSETEAGSVLGVSKWTIRRLRQAGDLTYVVVRHSIRIPTSEITEYQARQKVAAR
jgi:excisionase family DNA binding protein